MKITNGQAGALASQIRDKASKEAAKRNKAISDALRPKAKSEAKAAMAVIKKLPTWVKDSIHIGSWSSNKPDAKKLEDKFIAMQKKDNWQVRRDIGNQIMVASISCDTVEQIENKVVSLEKFSVIKED